MIVRFFGVRREERRDCRAGTEGCTGAGIQPDRRLPPVRAGVAAQRDTRAHLPSGGRTLDRRLNDGSEATMRAHDSDQGYQSDLRPKASRVEEPESALALKAALSGRLDAAGPAGVMGLQRAVGNAEPRLSSTRSARRSTTWSPPVARLCRGPSYRHGGRFGTDFGDVRVHNDGAAHDSAKSVNAQAYTVGSNVFQRDKYDPASSGQAHDRA